MTNPARNLHSVFVNWRSAIANGSTVAASRELPNPEAAETHLSAMRDLIAVERALDRLSANGYNIDVYRRYIPAWVGLLVSFRQPWDSAVDPDSIFPAGPLDQLEGLAALISGHEVVLDAAAEATLRQVVHNAGNLLKEDEAISPRLRQYLSHLLEEISIALNDETQRGRFDYAQAAERLWVALHAAGGQSTDDENKGRWSRLSEELLMPAAAGFIGGIPGNFLAIGQLLYGN